MSGLDVFRTNAELRHIKEVEAGKHDGSCEYGPRVFADRTGVTFLHMCHCAMRHRVSLGDTKLPDSIEWRGPLCPRCLEELDGDGDSWTCDDCHVSWDNRGENAEWTDEYGDLGTATS